MPTDRGGINDDTTAQIDQAAIYTRGCSVSPTYSRSREGGRSRGSSEVREKNVHHVITPPLLCFSYDSVSPDTFNCVFKSDPLCVSNRHTSLQYDPATEGTSSQLDVPLVGSNYTMNCRHCILVATSLPSIEVTSPGYPFYGWYVIENTLTATLFGSSLFAPMRYTSSYQYFRRWLRQRARQGTDRLLTSVVHHPSYCYSHCCTSHCRSGELLIEYGQHALSR